MHTCSSRVRKARSLAGLSQGGLAKRVGVQRSAVTQWERPGGTLPNVDHLMQIATETGVYFEWLATGRGPCCPAEGELTSAVIESEYAKDGFETQALAQLRRLSFARKKAAVEILEIMAR